MLGLSQTNALVIQDVGDGQTGNPDLHLVTNIVRY